RVPPSFPTRRSSDLGRRVAKPEPQIDARLRRKVPSRELGRHQVTAVSSRGLRRPFLYSLPERIEFRPELGDDAALAREKRGLLRSEEHTSELQSLAY